MSAYPYRKVKDQIHKSNIYKVVAVVFAIGGVVFFAYILRVSYGGNIKALVRDPLVVAFLFASFVPGYVFAWLSPGAYKKAIKMQDQQKQKQEEQ